LEHLAIEDVSIFNVQLVHFTAFWYILSPFGIFYGNFVYFSPFWYGVPRQIWQTWVVGDACGLFSPLKENGQQTLMMYNLALNTYIIGPMPSWSILT
jgi:hypothetical protein